MIGSYDTIEQVMDVVETNGGDWYNMLDTKTGEIKECSGRAFLILRTQLSIRKVLK